MLRAGFLDIDSALDHQLVHTANDWEHMRVRVVGTFGTKILALNDPLSSGCPLIHNRPFALLLAPGDQVHARISSSGFTFHFTSSLVWPNEIAGGRKMPSRSELIPLTLNETRNIIQSDSQWYEVTTLSQGGSSAYRIISGGDKRGTQYCEPPPGVQWRCIVGPGDYVSLLGGGTVSVGVTVTELPPVDKLVKKIMEKLRGL